MVQQCLYHASFHHYWTPSWCPLQWFNSAYTMQASTTTGSTQNCFLWACMLCKYCALLIPSQPQFSVFCFMSLFQLRVRNCANWLNYSGRCGPVWARYIPLSLTCFRTMRVWNCIVTIDLSHEWNLLALIGLICCHDWSVSMYYKYDFYLYLTSLDLQKQVYILKGNLKGRTHPPM